jgi:hypothetical protein
MSALHSLLAELGIEEPTMHPEREAQHQHAWVVNQPFSPLQGKSYDVTYGKIDFRGEEKHVLKKIRIDGPAPTDWYDLEEQQSLDPTLHALPVKGFREIG